MILITCAFGTANSGENIYYTVLDSDKSVYQARTNTGVTEIDSGSGVYGVEVAETLINGRTVLWDVDGTDKSSSETFINILAGAAGLGAEEGTVTITKDGVPIGDAQVWVTIDASGNVAVAGPLTTLSNGQVKFYLDNGVTYYVWAQKDGVNFSNPTQQVW